jgi:hypothetical protein
MSSSLLSSKAKKRLMICCKAEPDFFIALWQCDILGKMLK